MKKTPRYISKKSPSVTLGIRKTDLQDSMVSVDYEVTCISWAPNGQFITAGLSSNVAVWSSTSGELLLDLLSHAGDINHISWSPDATKFVSASQDETLELWNAVNGAPMVTLRGHNTRVNYVEWSPTDDVFASASNDQIFFGVR